MLDIPVDQHAYIERLAAKAGLALEEFVLKCLPHPKRMLSYTDQMQQAEEIMNRNREVLEKLSKS